MTPFQTHILGWTVTGKNLPEWLQHQLSTLWTVSGVASGVQGKVMVSYLEAAPTFSGKGLNFQLHTPAGHVAGQDRHGKLWLGNGVAGLSLEHSKNRIQMQVWGHATGLVAPLQALVLELLRFSGFVPVQGTVLTRNGLGYLVLGDNPTSMGQGLLCEGLCWYSPRDGKVYGANPRAPHQVVSVILHHLVVLETGTQGAPSSRLAGSLAMNLLHHHSGSALFATNRQHGHYLLRHLLLDHGVYRWNIEIPAERCENPIWQRSPFKPRQFAI